MQIKQKHSVAVSLQFNTIISLLGYRLRWYFTTMSEKLLRFKHGLLLAIALFIPTAQFFVYLSTEPILAIINPTQINFWHYLLKISVLQLVYLVWIYLQKESINPQFINAYFKSLPISQAIQRLINTIVIVIANNIFWIPFVITAYICMRHYDQNTCLFIARMLFLITSIIMLQLCLFHTKSLLFLVWIMCDVMLCMSIVFPSVSGTMVIILSLIVLLLLSKKRSGGFHIPKSIYRRTRINFNSAGLFKAMPLIMLQLTTIRRQYFLSFLNRLLIVVVLLSIGYCLVIYATNIKIQCIDIIIPSLSIFIMSGFYPLLKDIRASNRAYFTALPIRGREWYIADFMIITGVTLLVTTIFLSAQLFKHKMGYLMLCASQLTILLLSILLAITRNYFPKHGVWISFLTTFSYIVIIFNSPSLI